MGFFSRLFGGGSKETGSGKGSSKETLHCPNCNSALSVKRNRIGSGADAGMMGTFGVEQVRLQCPKCRGVMDVSLGVGKDYE